MSDDIHEVIITLEPAKGDYAGRVTYGYYKIEGDKLTMTGANGWPVVDQQGNRFERIVKDKDQAWAVAAKLTREIHNKLTSGNRGFNGPLLFPDETFV